MPKQLIHILIRTPFLLVTAAVTGFVLMDSLPGDAATIIARTTDEARVLAVRADLGLDRPLLPRLGEWANHLFLHADGGTLYASDMPVWHAAASSARNSGYLAACAIPLLLLTGVGAGVIAGLRPTSLRDRGLSAGAQATLATPDFAVTTLLLILLAKIFHVAPAVSLVPPGGTPLDRPAALIIPTLAIALIGGAWLQRLVRAAVVHANALPYVQAAHLAGHHPLTVLWQHTLPAAAAPILQACAATIPYALTGTVVVENVVGYPGIGTLIASFIAARETEAVASLIAIFAALTIVAFSMADLVGNAASRSTA